MKYMALNGHIYHATFAESEREDDSDFSFDEDEKENETESMGISAVCDKYRAKESRAKERRKKKKTTTTKKGTKKEKMEEKGEGGREEEKEKGEEESSMKASHEETSIDEETKERLRTKDEKEMKGVKMRIDDEDVDDKVPSAIGDDDGRERTTTAGLINT